MLCGSLCTFNDVVARNLPLQDLQIGDYLLFYNIGAYAVTEGGYLFLSRDLPTIYTGSSEDGLQVIREGLPTYPTNTPHYN
jgi:diaminopimelate decarboxylase